jgi:hypothetical protein
MAKQLGRELADFERSIPIARESAVELTDEEIRRLRSLGYIK